MGSWIRRDLRVVSLMLMVFELLSLIVSGQILSSVHHCLELRSRMRLVVDKGKKLFF